MTINPDLHYSDFAKGTIKNSTEAIKVVLEAKLEFPYPKSATRALASNINPIIRIGTWYFLFMAIFISTRSYMYLFTLLYHKVKKVKKPGFPGLR